MCCGKDIFINQCCKIARLCQIVQSITTCIKAVMSIKRYHQGQIYQIETKHEKSYQFSTNRISIFSYEVYQENQSIAYAQSLQDADNSDYVSFWITSGEVEFTAQKVQKEANQEKSSYSYDVFCFYWPVLTHSERNGETHDKQKCRENKVSRCQSIPLWVFQKPRCFWSYIINENHANHSQSPIDIDRLYPNFCWWR